MYKILGKRVAKCPDLVRPEANKKDFFDWAFIVAFTRKTNGEIKRYKKVLKGSSRNSARKIANSLIKEIRPEYIAIIYKERYRGPEIIFEKGNREIVDAWMKR